MKKFSPDKYPHTLRYVLEHDTVYIRCKRCGNTVLKSEIKGYDYQCMDCDQDLYTFETYKGEPHTEEEFNQLCLNTESELMLDYKELEKELDDLKQKQIVYATLKGGIINLKEADDIWNDYNRQIIEIYSKLHPNCRIGLFSNAEQTEYTGQKIYNFGCDYIIPEPDEDLKQILSTIVSIEPIFKRIEEIQGIFFIWR